MVVRGSGPNLQSELVCRCQLVPNPDLFDRFAHAVVVFSHTSPSFRLQAAVSVHQYAAAALAGPCNPAASSHQIVRAICWRAQLRRHAGFASRHGQQTFGYRLAPASSGATLPRLSEADEYRAGQPSTCVRAVVCLQSIASERARARRQNRGHTEMPEGAKASTAKQDWLTPGMVCKRRALSLVPPGASSSDPCSEWRHSSQQFVREGRPPPSLTRAVRFWVRPRFP